MRIFSSYFSLWSVSTLTWWHADMVTWWHLICLCGTYHLVARAPGGSHSSDIMTLWLQICNKCGWQLLGQMSSYLINNRLYLASFNAQRSSIPLQVTKSQRQRRMTDVRTWNNNYIRHQTLAPSLFPLRRLTITLSRGLTTYCRQRENDAGLWLVSLLKHWLQICWERRYLIYKCYKTAVSSPWYCNNDHSHQSKTQENVWLTHFPAHTNNSLTI